MDDLRRPVSGSQLPQVKWKSVGKRVRVDSALDHLRYRICYRYAPIAEVVALLDGRMTFAHPRTWPDQYEHLVNSLFGTEAPFSSCVPYVKCFSLEYSSDAMWKIYSGPGGLVRVGISLNRLIEQLDSMKFPCNGKIFLGRVRYMRPAALRNAVASLAKSSPKDAAAHAMQALLMKRAGFAFENEIRIAFLPGSEAEVNSEHVSASGFNPQRIKRALLDPYLAEWQTDEIRRLFGKLNKSLVVDRSKFDQSPIEL